MTVRGSSWGTGPVTLATEAEFKWRAMSQADKNAQAEASMAMACGACSASPGIPCATPSGAHWGRILRWLMAQMELGDIL